MTTGFRRLGRDRLVALVLAGPTLASAIGLIGVEAYRRRNPASPLFITPASASLAATIQRQDALATYELLRGGRDPRQPIAVSHPTLTGGRTVLVPPLVWAAAVSNQQVAALLLTFGPPIDAATRRRAACVAARFDNDEIVDTIALFGAITPPCHAHEDDGATLLH